MWHLTLPSFIATGSADDTKRLEAHPVARFWRVALAIGLCAASPAFAGEAPQPVHDGADIYAVTTNACVREFLLARGLEGKAVAVKVPSAPKDLKRIRQPYAMDLAAIDRSNGHQIWRTECVVRADGTVLRLNSRLGKVRSAVPLQARSSVKP